jgi:methionyl-tRNA formyltransferase
LKVTSACIADEDTPHEEVGAILSLENGITVACAKGAITLLGVLPEGKSRMAASDFVRGRRVSLGDILK